jgi:PII-like signaling protein
MELPRDASLLRIFIGERDECEGQPLFKVIVLKAREHHLAGATVFRGPIGFGRSSHLHTSGILRLSLDLPIVIEIVDTEEKIQSFLATIEGILTPGLVTIEHVQAIFYKGKTDQP